MPVAFDIPCRSALRTLKVYDRSTTENVSIDAYVFVIRRIETSSHFCRR